MEKFDFVDEVYLFRHCVKNCEKRLGDFLDKLICKELDSCHPKDNKEMLFIAFRVCAIVERVFEDLYYGFSSFSDDVEEDESLNESDSEEIRNSEFTLKV